MPDQRVQGCGEGDPAVNGFLEIHADISGIRCESLFIFQKAACIQPKRCEHGADGFVGAPVIGGTEIIYAPVPFQGVPEIADDFVYVGDPAHIVCGIAEGLRSLQPCGQRSEEIAVLSCIFCAGVVHPGQPQYDTVGICGQAFFLRGFLFMAVNGGRVDGSSSRWGPLRPFWE